MFFIQDIHKKVYPINMKLTHFYAFEIKSDLLAAEKRNKRDTRKSIGETELY